MTGVQAFQKSSDGMEDYKQSIQKGIKLSQENEFIPQSILENLQNKLENDLQKGEFIKRADLLNFGDNIETILENDELKKDFIAKSKEIQQSDKNKLEKTFDFITLAQDLINKFQSQQEEIKKEKRKQEKLDNLKQQEQQEKENLPDLYDMLDEVD